MSLLLFAWAYATCEERKPRITKWKILANNGIRTLGPFAYEAKWLSCVLLYEVSIEHLNVGRVKQEYDIQIYL